MVSRWVLRIEYTNSRYGESLGIEIRIHKQRMWREIHKQNTQTVDVASRWVLRLEYTNSGCGESLGIEIRIHKQRMW